MKEFDYQWINSKIRIILDKKEMKLILDMHGTIGIDEYLEELMQNIKNQILEIE